mgnify:CR=1 FL=1
MKKSLVALAVLGTLAGTASAQSSVTAFGTIDLAMRYTKANGQSLSKLDSDGLSSSRLGFRGVDHTNPGVEIIHRGRFRSLTDLQRRWLKRRQAVASAGLTARAQHAQRGVRLQAVFALGGLPWALQLGQAHD